MTFWNIYRLVDHMKLWKCLGNQAAVETFVEDSPVSKIQLLKGRDRLFWRRAPLSISATFVRTSDVKFKRSLNNEIWSSIKNLNITSLVSGSLQSAELSRKQLLYLNLHCMMLLKESGGNPYGIKFIVGGILKQVLMTIWYKKNCDFN